LVNSITLTISIASNGVGGSCSDFNSFLCFI
jgi:hypothetical protein